MAHELTIRENGFTEMAFIGETPWHGLGQELQVGADLETWKKASGMDWTIKSSPVQYITNGPSIPEDYNNLKFDGQNVLYRSDNNNPLSIVSDRYEIVQPIQVLEFFDNLATEAGFKLETAGTLRGGKRFWALANTGKFGEVCNDDRINSYVLLSTSCDRSLATTARFTSVRVVCNNTLRMATNENQSVISVPHSTVFNAEKIQNNLNKVNQAFDNFMWMGKHLQEKQVNATYAQTFLTALLTPINQVNNEDYNIKKTKGFQKIIELFDTTSKGNQLVGHTKWGLLNAVTEYYDYHIPNRSNDTRLDNAWFGSGDRVKNKAVELLLSA
jgi:phage/plasmid-like protein (TIGR03299 family)